ncbi:MULTISPECIES: phosphoadenylyl-sulfate reductase [unclassified Nocardioides]|uniref:phosphoadenylyl-sulfate reductase n=1 Tax=unclassified Nocardioides TaxID=2615069 RepID=UPI000057003D|nr:MULTISPECIES: phosphoadenylyl-sulfate reductase [unclassified Nocardioides]ABL79418.1 phosphoadenylylsulfate reductase (thioredoxin) [Nocardioides sp. JS614]
MKTPSEISRLRSLVAQRARDLEGASAEAVISWAQETFGARLCATSSMGDVVIVHQVSRYAPGLDVLFLDTGYHFAETLAFRELVSSSYDVNVVDLRPERSVEEQLQLWDRDLFDSDPDGCCRLRKVLPLRRALTGYDAWVTGIRRADSPRRAETPVLAWDEVNQVVKVAPLATWTREMVEGYLEDHALPRNRLTELGYTSIGCQPCTSLPTGLDPRSGRWPGLQKTECGLHRT